MVKSSYYEDITPSNESYRFNHIKKDIREIRIDDITKTKESLFITTGNVINRIKLSDLKRIIKLVMEE